MGEVGMIKEKTNGAVESECIPGVDKKGSAGRFRGMSNPYASSSHLTLGLPRSTVNQVR